MNIPYFKWDFRLQENQYFNLIMKQFNNAILDKQNYFLNNEREALIKQQQQQKDEKKNTVMTTS